MSHNIRSPLSFCSFLGVGVLVMLLGLTRLSAMPAPDREITNSIGMKLALIPAGKFLMGSPKDEKQRNLDEEQHEVSITKPFYLGVYVVTQAEYEQSHGEQSQLLLPQGRRQGQRQGHGHWAVSGGNGLLG